MMSENLRITVIIPALNEESAIGAVVRGMPWHRIRECIVVDNGSTDATAQRAAEAGARVIRSPRGYGAAMSTGAAAASSGSDILLFMDGDGADVIEEFDRIVGPVERNEADLVLGSRILGDREPGSMLFSQVFAANLIGWLIRLRYRHDYTDMCAFRAIRRDALDRMHMQEMTFGWNLEMQIKAVRNGLRILEIPVRYRNRMGGVSKVSGDLKASFQAGSRILAVFLRVDREH